MRQCNAQIVFERTIEDKYEILKSYESCSHTLVAPRTRLLRLAKSETVFIRLYCFIIELMYMLKKFINH